MNKRSIAPTKSPAGGHTIAVVAERTGLSRDVLRVWERRYGAVEPERSAGGQRLYSDEELVRFQLLAQATRFGRAIGSVARLSTGELERILANDLAAKAVGEPATAATFSDRIPDHSEDIVGRALSHTLGLDAPRLDAELRWHAARQGLPIFLHETVPTLMHRIGDEWMAGRVGIPHEHLASAVVLNILLDAIRAIPEVPSAPRLVVATPSGEQHVIGAALIAAVAAVDGWNILFLGASVPADALASAAAERKADAVALSMVLVSDEERMLDEIRLVRSALSNPVPLVLGGASAVRLSNRLALPGVSVCRDLGEAQSVFASIARGST